MNGTISTTKCNRPTISLLGRDPTGDDNRTIERYMDFLNMLASFQIPYDDQPVVI